MQQSNGKHCYVCGNTHSNECNPDDFDYFQCTECKTLQQLPSDVCGFGGLSGIRCACNREASKVWRHVSFEEYKKLNNAVPADTGNELAMYKLIAADAAENCSLLLKRAEEAERHLAATRDLLLMFAQSIDEAHRIAESSSNKESILSAFDGSKYKARERLNNFAIEQQIKGVNDFANKFCGECDTEYRVQLGSDANYYCNKLRQQLNGGENDDN